MLPLNLLKFDRKNIGEFEIPYFQSCKITVNRAFFQNANFVKFRGCSFCTTIDQEMDLPGNVIVRTF